MDVCIVGALAEDEVMVQGIVYTSVSPDRYVPQLLGLVSVVHIFFLLLSLFFDYTYQL